MFRGKVASNDSVGLEPSTMTEEEMITDPASTETKGKKKRSRGRRRKGKSRNNTAINNDNNNSNNKQEPHNKQLSSSCSSNASKNNKSSKKRHDAPMKKRDLYFCMTCAMVAVKGGGSVVARVTIVNWDMELVLDTFVYVPVPVSDFGDSGVTPSDIRKSITNAKAKSFAQVRQDVEKILCGKILIGHHLPEKLTALGLTHPITDVRDTSAFFGDADLRELSEVLLQKELPASGKSDFPLQSCCAALDLYKAHRKEWEEDLIQQAQERQKLLIQQHTPPPSGYHSFHPEQQQQQQHNSHHHHNNPHDMMHSPYSNQPSIMSQHQQQQHSMQDNASWFVRANVPVSSQPQSTPLLSDRAMQALSSYSHYSVSPDEAFERGSSFSSHDGSSIIDSSNYSSSIFGGTSSHVSEPWETASVASWQQEEQHERPESSNSSSTSTSSWFRFGSKASNSKNHNPPSSPYHEKMERRMSAVCEEPEDYLVEELQLNKSISQEQQQEDSILWKEKSWFAFRRSKSPSHSVAADSLAAEAQEEEEEPPPQEQQAPPPLSTTTLEPAALAAAPSQERSSSWFSKIRRAKSPTAAKMAASSIVEASQSSKEAAKMAASPIIETAQSFTEPTESTYAENDDDWLQEVMDNNNNRKLLSASASEDGASVKEEEAEEGEVEGTKEGSSTWFRFLRSPRSPKTNRSRLPSLENEFSAEFHDQLQLEQQPGDNVDFWDGIKPLSSKNDETSHWTDSIFASRTRIATESTIPSIATEDFEEDDCMSRDILIGMEQNLAFLNI